MGCPGERLGRGQVVGLEELTQELVLHRVCAGEPLKFEEGDKGE